MGSFRSDGISRRKGCFLPWEAAVRRSLLALALLLALPAWAYHLTGRWWSWQDHPIEDGFSIALADFPTDAGSSAEIETALTSAMSTWNDQDRDVLLQYDGQGVAGLEADGHNIIGYGAYPGLSTTLAFAATWSYEDGAAFDCDLYFLSENDYGTIYWDADSNGPASGRYDIEGVALHELGHCLGLDHSDDSTAVMYAYYNGSRSLTSDDISGFQYLYPEACPDEDGDGYRGCDADCDDANAGIHPGAAEVCDGVDGDCDGLIDAATLETFDLVIGGLGPSYDWIGAGNVIQADQDSTLVRFRQGLTAEVGTRLVWTVYLSEDSGSTWSLMRSDISNAVAGGTQASPDLYLKLQRGKWYSINLGAMAMGVATWLDGTPDLRSRGPFTPLGGVYGRPMGDEMSAADGSYLYDQELELIAAPDPDGDGQSALCGDCDEADVGVYSGALELCDGKDQDCDGSIDEDWAVDADGDGIYDCKDACPQDPLDDQDGDGVCADLDPCPEDPQDLCDDPVDSQGAEDSVDSPDLPEDSGEPKKEQPAACGCNSGATAGLFGWMVLPMLRRRRC